MKFPMKATIAVAALTCIASNASAQTGARITLDTGEEISGVMKGNGYETIRNGRFVAAEESTPGAGLRLFSPQGASGFVFIARASIATIDRGVAAPRTSFDAAAAFRAWAEWRERERERIAAYRALDAAREAARDEPEEPDRRGPKIDEDRRRELIQRYHPGLGYTPGYRSVLQWRSITLDVFPSDEERAWLNVYDEWLIAYMWWLDRGVPSAEGRVVTAGSAKRPGRR